jgi:hypothetical protein
MVSQWKARAGALALVSLAVVATLAAPAGARAQDPPGKEKAPDITAVLTPLNSGPTGGATQGEVSLAVDRPQIQARVTGTCPSGAISAIAKDGTVTCQADGGGAAWLLAGNADTDGDDFLGTTDNQRLTLRVNNTVGWRLQPGETSWSSLSDRAAKANLAAVDGRVVLEALAEVAIAT